MPIAKQPVKYNIALPEFAGPLDLLLYLIEQEELDITTISLVEVTEQYLAQIEKMKEDRIDQLIDFLVVGARLVQIKSRALLPNEPTLPVDGEEEEDPAEALLRQLRQYRRFKEAAQWLQMRESAGLRSYLRVVPPKKPQGKLDLSDVTLQSLLRAVKDALARADDLEESVSLIRPRQITLADQIKRLRNRIRSNPTVQFDDLLSAHSSRIEIAITLLAVLELIKRREVTAAQNLNFGPIEIRKFQKQAPI